MTLYQRRKMRAQRGDTAHEMKQSTGAYMYWSNPGYIKPSLKQSKNIEYTQTRELVIHWCVSVCNQSASAPRPKAARASIASITFGSGAGVRGSLPMHCIFRILMFVDGLSTVQGGGGGGGRGGNKVSW
jgi:hypothetical protein